jgi:hypothetical protein
MHGTMYYLIAPIMGLMALARAAQATTHTYDTAKVLMTALGLPIQAAAGDRGIAEIRLGGA